MPDRTASSLLFAARMEQRRRTAKGITSPEPTKPVTPERLPAAEEKAAVLGRFDPELLARSLEIDGALKITTLNWLAAFCSVEPAGDQSTWMLQSTHRSEVLRRIVTEKRLAQVLSGPLPPDDRPGEVLRAVLSGSLSNVDTLDREGLLAVAWALEALASINIPKPDLNQVRQRLASDRFLADQDVLLEKGFFGRTAELAQLTAFLNTPGSPWRLAVLSGLGGAGKSTLLAKFAGDTFRAQSATVVVLDFDRPGVDGADTQWLEMEMTRQVGAQYPPWDAMLRQARENVRGAYGEEQRGKEQFSSDGLESLRGSTYSLLSSISGVLTQAGSGRPLLLILDTVEEVVQRGQTGGVIEWIENIASVLWQIPLRVVVSGRVSLPSLAGVAKVDLDVPLPDLSEDEAEALLANLGVTAAVAKRLSVSEVLPRRPLEMRLLAKLFKDCAPSAIEELENDLRSGGPAAKGLFAGLVYRRVLLRIKAGEDAGGVITDQTLQTLAYPGLVLRYVTSDLIQKVLAPGLGLPAFSNTDASKALDLLAKHEWLVTRQGDQAWHRRDLRRSVLKPMIAENPQRAALIHRLAIEYFEAAPTEAERAEGMYHRLMSLTGAPEESRYDLLTIQKAGSYIEPDRSDLPPRGAALLTFAQTRDVAVEQIPLLPGVHRKQAYRTKGETLVASREFGSALRLYEKQHEPLMPWELRMLCATVEWEELGRRLVLPPRTVEWGRFSEDLFAGALTRTLQPSDVHGQLLDVSDATQSGLSTTIQLLTFAGVMASPMTTFGKGLLDLVRPRIASLIASDDVLAKRLVYLWRMAGSWPNYRLPFSPSTIVLHPAWLDEAPKRFPADLPETDFVNQVRDILTQPGPRNTRGILSFIQSIRVRRDLQGPSPIPTPDDLWWYMKDPTPEFRDPARFAILEACRDEAAYAQFSALLQTLIPYQLDDLEPDAFVRQLGNNPEHALEAYVELADRAGVLEDLLRQASAFWPAAPKLRMVLTKLEEWRGAARALIFSTGG
jgi:hypothetical protein